MEVGRTAGTRTSRRLLEICALIGITAGLLAACGGSATGTKEQGPTLNLSLEPSAPVVGTSRLELVITEPDGLPLSGAQVRIEGNMNHAGMVPEFADASETQPGRYEAELEFTMGGDWFLLVEAQAPDGRQLSWKEDVPGVRTD